MGIESSAKAYIKSLTICQVNEKHKNTEKECNLEKNLKIIVGNEPFNQIDKLPYSKLEYIRFPGALYLNKPLCVNVDIHDDAEIYIGRAFNKPGAPGHAGAGTTTIEDMRKRRGTLSVEINVVGDYINYDNGPCSISHVIVEYDSTIFPLGY